MTPACVPQKRFECPFHWEKFKHEEGAMIDANHKPCYIHGLPVEILSEIFELSISRRDPDKYHAYLLQITPGDTPLSLLLVCRKWRDVALGTRPLWNSLCPSLNSIPCMKYWLTVAPPVPLHLKFLDHVLDEGNPEFPRMMLQLFSSVSNRWKSLSIDLTPWIAEEFLSILQSPEKQPLLVEELILTMLPLAHHRLTNDTISATLAHLSSLPHLKRLHLESDWRCHQFDLRAIPWSTLEDISLWYGLTPIEAFSCLTQCKSARTIDFRCMRCIPHNQLQPEFPGKVLTTLPHLTCLILTEGAVPILILQSLSLPSIRSLCIEFECRDHVVLDKFLARTPTLETLLMIDVASSCWDSDILSDDDIITYLLNSHLRHIPSVYLRFEGAQERVPKVMKKNPSLGSEFPPLICWEPLRVDSAEKLPYRGRVLVGWDDDLGSHPRWDAYWQFRDGKIELPPPRRRSMRLDPDKVQF